MQAGEPLSPVARISEYLAKASSEEQHGCFGLSEVYFTKAFQLATAHIPNDKLTAQVAAALGLFLNRFIPFSEQPAEYLRVAVAIERAIDECSRESKLATLQLAKCLIDCGDCGEAEPLLQAVIRTQQWEDIEVRCVTHLSRINDELAISVRKKDVLNARIRLPGSEALAETLFYFAEASRHYDKEACLAALQEVLSLKPSDEVLRKTVRLLSKIHSESNDAQEMECKFQSILAALKSCELRPYLLAELLTILGDAFSWRQSNYESQQYYSSALRIYEDANPHSWNATWVKMKMDARQYEDPFAWTSSDLAVLHDSLPTAFAILAIQDKYVPARFFLRGYIEKLQVLTHSRAQGEALLALYCLNGRCGRRIKGIAAQMRAYAKQHPSSKAAVRLQARYDRFCTRTVKKMGKRRYADACEGLFRSLHLRERSQLFPAAATAAYTRLYSLMRTRVFNPYKVELRYRLRDYRGYLDCAVRLSTALAPSSFECVEALRLLGELLISVHLYAEAKELLSSAISRLRGVRIDHPQSDWSMNALKRECEKARVECEALRWLEEYASRAVLREVSSLGTAKVVKFLFFAYLEGEQFSRAESLIRSYLDGLTPALEVAESVHLLGLLHLQAHNYPEAERHFERSLDLLLELAPNHQLLGIQLGLLTHVFKVTHTAAAGKQWLQGYIDRLLPASRGGKAVVDAVHQLRELLLRPEDFSDIGGWLEHLASVSAKDYSGSQASAMLQRMLLSHYGREALHHEALKLLPILLSELHARFRRFEQEAPALSVKDFFASEMVSMSAACFKQAMEAFDETEWESHLQREHTAAYEQERYYTDWHLSEHQLQYTELKDWLMSLRCKALLSRACKQVEAAIRYSCSVGTKSLLAGLASLYERDHCFAEAERTLVKNGPRKEWRGNMNREVAAIRMCYGNDNYRRYPYGF